MRTPALVIGILLLIAGGLVVAGVIDFTRQETVAEIGPVELSTETRETAPPVLGWVLLGAGAVAVVAGVISKK